MNRETRFLDWTLEYSAATGQPLSLRRRGVGEVFHQLEPMILLLANGRCASNSQDEMYQVVDGETIGLSSALAGESFVETGETALLEVKTTLEAGWGLTYRYHFGPENVRLELVIAYEGDEPQRLRHIAWRVGGVLEKDYGGYEILTPSYTPPFLEPLRPFQAIDEFRSDQLVTMVYRGEHSPQFYSGMVGSYRREEPAAFLSWYVSDTFPCHLLNFCRSSSGQLTRVSEIYCPRWMKKGESLVVDGLYFGGFSGGRTEAVKAAAASYNPLWRKEEDFADARCFHAMEITIGEKLYLSPFPDFDALTAQLPAIRKLGYDVIQVMPYFPYPGYSIQDWDNVDVTYGGAQGLRDMVEAAHRLGIRVILDVSLHGPFDFDPDEVELPLSPLTGEHPDWFARHETGVISHTYSRSLDMSHPAYQALLEESLLEYLRTYKVDGFRLDAQHWNGFPNWDPAIDRQPYEMLMAGARMIDRMRAACRAEFPDTVIYTESSGPLMSRAHDYRYNYDLYWALWGALAPVRDTRSSNLFYFNYLMENTLSWPDFAQWYEEMRATMPDNMVVVNHVDSHDFHERCRYIGGQYSRDLFGPEIHRVLFGMIAFLDGGVMSYYGAELGNEAFYSQVLGLRRDCDIFRHGQMLCTAAVCDDPKTVAILWRDVYEWAFYLGNLEEKAKTVRLKLAGPEIRDMLIFRRYNLVDHLNRRRKFAEITADELLEGITIDLPPTGTYVLEGLGF